MMKGLVLAMAGALLLALAELSCIAAERPVRATIEAPFPPSANVPPAPEIHDTPAASIDVPIY
jgi:hypothetical protein